MIVFNNYNKSIYRHMTTEERREKARQYYQEHAEDNYVMTADFIIINPPYDGSLHLAFLKAGWNCLSETGQMVIVEPASWLIRVDKDIKDYTEVKDMLKGHVKAVTIENLNRDFGIRQNVPCSITHICKEEYDGDIDFRCCGDHDWVKSLDDCNLIGQKDLVQSILRKARGLAPETVQDRMIIAGKKGFDPAGYENEHQDQCYLRIANFMMNNLGSKYSKIIGEMPLIKKDNTWYKYCRPTALGMFLDAYVHTLCLDTVDITDRFPRGITNPDSYADCIHGTRQELETFRKFVYTNRLPLFIGICCQYDQQNHAAPNVPFVCDRELTDEQIEKEIRLSKDEIALIDRTLAKFELHTEWSRRYMTGDRSVNPCDRRSPGHADNAFTAPD